jgi:MFS family permease
MRSEAILFLSTGGFAMSLAFIPLLAEELGASNFLIGVIVAVYGLTQLFSMYFFGWISDTRGRLRLVRGGMIVSAIALALQAFAFDPLSLFLLRGLCGLAVGISYSSLIIYGLECGKRLGKFTSFESLGWGLGILLAGWIGEYERIFLFSGFVLFISFVLSMGLREKCAKTVQVPFLPSRLIKKNLNIYFPFLIRDLSAYALWSFLPLFFLGLGANKLWIGVLYFMNTGNQFFFKQFVDRFDHELLYRGGMILSAAGFFGYYFSTDHIVVIFPQIIIAVAWSALSVGTMGLLTDKNTEKATVIGLFASTRGVAQIVAPLFAGAFMMFHDFKSLALMSGAATVLALSLHLLFSKRV